MARRLEMEKMFKDREVFPKVVKVKPTDIKNDERVYKMTSKPRGMCLIFNNRNFPPSNEKKNKRNGTEYDAVRLRHVFTKLGFKVTLKDNATVEDMKYELSHFASLPNHHSCDAGVVIFLTHGGVGTVFGVDEEQLSVLEIVGYLNNANCPGLRDKPKLIFLQACQGSSPDFGVAEDGTVLQQDNMATRSDILISFAAQTEYTTLRMTNKGGFYATYLAEVLSRDASTANLEEMLKTVEGKMRETKPYVNDKERCLSTQVVELGWRKSLYFNPGASNSEAAPKRTQERTRDGSPMRQYEQLPEESSLPNRPGQYNINSGIISGSISTQGGDVHQVPVNLQNSTNAQLRIGGDRSSVAPKK